MAWRRDRDAQGTDPSAPAAETPPPTDAAPSPRAAAEEAIQAGGMGTSQHRLVLTGITTTGSHGASPGERDDPQEFLVDVDAVITVDGDALEGTADYRAIVGAVLEAVEQSSVVLLESLAKRIAASVYDLDRIDRVTVRVHKPRAADRLGMADLAAEASAG